MDAITLLKRDHEQVRRLFTQVESARAPERKRQLTEKLVKLLTTHSMAEEQLLYPVLRERGEELDALTLEALEEHHVAKWLLREVDRLPVDHERFDAKLSVLKENVLHHAKEEEQQIFKLMRQAFVREELDELGVMLAELKRISPTRPHPRAPDQPPGNLVAGGMAAVVDRTRDLARDVRRGAMGAVRERVEGVKALPTRLAAKSRRAVAKKRR